MFTATFVPAELSAQNIWTKYSGNPVLNCCSDSWNIYLSQPAIIKDGNIYHMWYTGYDAAEVTRIVYATSNGIFSVEGGFCYPSVGEQICVEVDHGGNVTLKGGFNLTIPRRLRGSQK